MSKSIWALRCDAVRAFRKPHRLVLICSNFQYLLIYIWIWLIWFIYRLWVTNVFSNHLHKENSASLPCMLLLNLTIEHRRQIQVQHLLPFYRFDSSINANSIARLPFVLKCVVFSLLYSIWEKGKWFHSKRYSIFSSTEVKSVLTPPHAQR